MRSPALILSLPTLVALAPALASGYGEGDSAGPSLEERALHSQTDRARVEPGATDDAFASLPAVRPLVANADLGDAARFYADDMSQNDCFPADHSSCDGTSYATRVDSFYAGRPIGENIARGQPDAETAVFVSWLYSAGHRANMLSASFDEFGGGHAAPGGPFWVQDFGFGGHEAALLTSGSHAPLQVDPSDAIEFITAFYDPEGAAPASVQLVIDTVCTPMEDDCGAPGAQTFVGSRSAPDEEGCLPYWFLAETAAGVEVAFPTTGSLLAPVGGATCAPFTIDRRGAECAPQGTGQFGGSGGGCGGSGAGYDPDANVGGNAEYGSCALAAKRQPAPIGWALLLAAARLRRRR